MTNFIGRCKQEKIRYVVSKTVEDEVTTTLPIVINRYFDRARIMAFPVRNQVYLKCRRRFLSLLKHRTKIDHISPNFDLVKNMYANFAKNAKLREKLMRKKRRKRRKSLLPSDTDMKILGEASTLSRDHRVIFVTDDGDYLNFKDEIEEKLKLKIIALLDLPHFDEIV